MMRSLRDTCGLVLAALILVTALHVGAIRGQAKVAGSVVLCTTAGTVTVAVDADGQPVRQAAHCPDCVVSILAGLAPPSFRIRHAARLRRLSFGRSRVSGRAQVRHSPPARGPPRLS